MAVTYDVLVFHEEQLREKVREIAKEALVKGAESIMSNSSFGGSGWHYGSTIAKESYDEVIEVVSGDLLAWVREYGSGKAVDTSNPFWGEYLASELSNRAGTVVRNRGRGSYSTLDTHSGDIITRERGGVPEGRPIRESSYDKFTVSPTPYLQEMLEEGAQVFMKELASMLDQIDPDDFITKETRSM